MTIKKRYSTWIVTAIVAVVVLTAGGVFDAFAGFLRTANIGMVTPVANPNSFEYGYGLGDYGFGYGTGYGYISGEAINNSNARYASGLHTAVVVPVTSGGVVTTTQTLTGPSNISIEIPANTTITVGGTPWDGEIEIPTYSTGFSGLPSGETPQGTVELDFGATAQFSKPVKITIPVGAGLTSVAVKVDHGAGAGFAGLTLDPNATCTAGAANPAYNGAAIAVVGGNVTIYTCSASTFVAYTQTSGGGGGGGYYVAPTSGKNIIESGSTGEDGDITDSPYSEELNKAYQFAFKNGITTVAKAKDADLGGNLIRSHMAKMMSEYAIKIMGRKPDTSKKCTFSDTASQDTGTQSYITLACQLGIMGVGTEKFNPNSVVTRAEFGTVLSRILYGEANNGGTPYYAKHLNALKSNSIISNITPNLKEIRGYAMIMFQRIAEKK